MNIIEVKNMDLSIELNGLVTSIIGPSNSGKTVLAKKLCNRLDNSDVFIDGKNISDYDIFYLKERIAVVLDNNDFETDLVYDEFLFFQECLNIDEEESKKRINDIVTFFNVQNLLEEKISSLYICDKILIKILALLLINPEVFVIDNLLSYLKEDKRNLLFKYIRENNISFVNITTNSEQLLKSDNVIVLNNFKAVITSSPKNILEGNSILPYMGIKLPFIVDLSHNLILYNVVSKIYFDNRKLVDKLWK